jgi:DNA-binding response OmpR family regulator
MSLAAAPSTKVQFNLDKTSILLIDGDELSMNLLSQILSGFGAHDLARSDKVEDSRAILNDTKFHLIVLDPTSLASDGYALVEWTRRHSVQNRFTPVLIATGHTQASRIGAARDSGANFVVTKPFVPAVILQRIRWMARDARHYVDCAAYAGPERRFHSEGAPGGRGRREEDRAAEALFSSSRELSQSDIDQIMSPASGKK